MKVAVGIIIILVSTHVCGQNETSRNFLGLQFGGQAIVGFAYDRILFDQQFFALNGAIGLVQNESADDTDPTDRPIYGLNLGVIGLYDIPIKYLSVETGFYASPYFYKSLTFINYYGWFGLRIHSKTSDGAFASIGWSPSFYFSKNPPDSYNNVKIGIKIGVNF